LDKALRARWEAASGIPDLVLPAPNPFVPEDLELRPATGGEHPAKPQRLALDEDLAKVAIAYFRKDEDFALPKAVAGFMFHCPFAQDSAANGAKAELWSLAVQEELSEFAYDAQMAGLSYSVGAASTGLVVSFGGYNDKLPVLLAAVAEKMASLSEVSEQTFKITREILERGLVNAAARSTPYQQGLMEEDCMLHQPAYSMQERLEALRSLSGREALSGVGRELLSSCHVDCLLQGNLGADEAKQLVASFLKPLGISQPLSTLPPMGTAKLPPGWTILEREGTNPEERNGAVVVTLQVAEQSATNNLLMGLTDQILKQRFFDDLRTKQQLGYIVSASAYSERHSFLGLRLIVQSEKPVQEVLDRVREWLDGAWPLLAEGVTEEEFLEYRAALVSSYRQRPKSLGEEFGRNWGVVSSRTFDFWRREQLLEQLQGVQLQELRVFAREKLQHAPTVAVLVNGGNGVSSAGNSGELGAAAAAATAASGDWEENWLRRWSASDVAEFRKGATWLMRPDAVEPSVVAEVPPSSRL